MTLPEDLFFLALVSLVRSMVLSAWAGQSGEVTPFIRGNVRRLRWIAGLLAALWFYHLFLPTLTDELSVYSAQRNALNNFGQLVGEDTPWYLSNGYLAVALLLLILAQVFLMESGFRRTSRVWCDAGKGAESTQAGDVSPG